MKPPPGKHGCVAAPASFQDIIALVRCSRILCIVHRQNLPYPPDVPPPDPRLKSPPCPYPRPLPHLTYAHQQILLLPTPQAQDPSPNTTFASDLLLAADELVAAAAAGAANTNAGMRPSKLSQFGRSHYFQIPKDPVGTLAILPGCARSAQGFWPYDPAHCPECLGFTEDGERLHNPELLTPDP